MTEMTANMSRADVPDTVSVRFNPLLPPYRDQPELAYTEFLDAGVAWCPDLGMYVVARREDVLRVLHDPDTFSSAAALPPMWDLNPPEVTETLADVWPRVTMLIEADGPRHRAVREVYLRALTARRVRAQKERMRDLANTLVTGMLARPGVRDGWICVGSLMSSWRRS